MASKKINLADLIFRITDDGTLKAFEQETKKAGKSVDRLSRSEHTLNRNFKGASKQSSSTTKNFSKMAQGITGGLVPAYATLAANIFAITAAFRFLQDAANFRILIEGQREYATITGESLKLITTRLQAATGQQLAFSEAAQSVAIGRAAGLTSDQISRLGTVAKNASIALGRDLTDSLNRLVRGATKAEPELLDELGIILRLETATKRYADSLKIAKEDLTIFQKSQAVVNEVLRQGEEKFGEFNTELNQFQLLAKSFDDLLNKIKMGLTGVAEFIARRLTGSVTALAGSFALLGSGILRAITPEAPSIDVQKSAKGARKGIRNMLTPEGKTKFGELGSKKDLKAFETALDRKNSKFINYTKVNKAAGRQMAAALQVQMVQVEMAQAGSFKRMGLRWKLELKLMQVEYGKFVGMVKFLGMGLSRFISALGWAGLIISLVTVLGGLFEKFRDPATKKFEENLKAVNERLEEQNKVTKEIAENMKTAKSFMAQFIQEAKFFSNFSFQGLSEAFGTEGTGRRLNEVTEATAQRLSRDQVKLVDGVIESLQTQRSRIGDADSKEAKDLDRRINTLSDALESAQRRYMSNQTFQIIVGELKDLEENGTLAQKSIEAFTNTTNLLSGAADTFGNAMSSMRSKGSAFFRMSSSIGQFGETLQGIGKSDATKVFEKFGSTPAEMVADTATIDSLRLFLGDEAVDKILAKKKVDDKGVITNAQSLLKDLGDAAVAESERLNDIEIKFLTERTKLSTQLTKDKIGMPKLIQAELDKQFKVNDIQTQINHVIKKREELKDKGEVKNKVEIAQENAKLQSLRAQLDVAERAANEMLSARDALVDTFSNSMMNAIKGLIEGTMQIKDAFKSMTTAVLQMMAQILAKMAALRILRAIGLPVPMEDGGIIPMAKGGMIRGYRAGGVVKQPTFLVGEGKHNEAVVPLPDGRSIPVEMNGGAGTNNITINVDASGNSSSTFSDEQGKALGMAIQASVMETLQREKRPGGVLS
tara:strand:- start:177 stop:3164 length:2988 start_codon:yes stop_codon:yes gene_type:complete